MAIKQSVTLNTTPEELYSALISSVEFAKVTGAPAEIADDEGGAFSCFGGQIRRSPISGRCGKETREKASSSLPRNQETFVSVRGTWDSSTSLSKNNTPTARPPVLMTLLSLRLRQ